MKRGFYSQSHPNPLRPPHAVQLWWPWGDLAAVIYGETEAEAQDRACTVADALGTDACYCGGKGKCEVCREGTAGKADAELVAATEGEL